MKRLIDLNLNKVNIVFFDFDGVFTDNNVYISESGLEQVQCSRSDGLGLRLLRKINLPLYIVSTETNNVVQTRASKLEIPCFHAVVDKARVVRDLCSQNRVPLQEAMFVGNDINDLEALKIVGFPIGVGDSYEELNDFIIAKTIKYGGQGAVREVCERIYNSKTE